MNRSPNSEFIIKLQNDQRHCEPQSVSKGEGAGCHLGYLDGLAAWRVTAAKKHAVSLKWGPVSEASTMDENPEFF